MPQHEGGIGSGLISSAEISLVDPPGTKLRIKKKKSIEKKSVTLPPIAKNQATFSVPNDAFAIMEEEEPQFSEPRMIEKTEKKLMELS